MRPRISFALVFLMAWVGLSPLARAKPQPVAVVISAGESDLMIESLVRAAAENALRSAEREAAPLAAAGGANQKALLACVNREASCVAAAASNASAAELLFVQLHKGESELLDKLVLTLRMYRTRDGVQIAFDRSRCEGCEQPEILAQVVEDLTADLLVSAFLETDSKARQLKTESSKPKKNRRSLQLTSKPSEASTKQKKSQLPYWVMGTGLLVTGMGVSLVALDGPRTVDGNRSPTQRASATEGYIAMGAGVSLAIAGALWMLKDDGASSELRVGAALSKQSGFVSMGRLF